MLLTEFSKLYFLKVRSFRHLEKILFFSKYLWHMRYVGSFLKPGGSVYRNDPKFADRYSWANSADPDQTAPDQGLHCLPFCLHRLDSLFYGRAT